MSCFCCPCRFESRKNPHFGAQKGAKYELYINKDGIFSCCSPLWNFRKNARAGHVFVFRVGDFSTPFRRHAVFPRLSTVIPASSVKCIAFSRLAPGSPRAVFLHASSLFAFSRVSAPPLGRSLSPTPGVQGFCSVAGRVPSPLWRSLSPTPGVPGFCSIAGRVTPPLWRSWSPTPGVPVFCSTAGRSSPPLGRSLSPAAGRLSAPAWAFFVPALAFFVSHVGRAGFLFRCRAAFRARFGVLGLPRRAGFFVPAWAFVVSRAGRAGFLLRCRAGFRAADGSPSGNKRSRVLPGSGKHTESGGSSQMSFRRF